MVDDFREFSLLMHRYNVENNSPIYMRFTLLPTFTVCSTEKSDKTISDHKCRRYCCFSRI